LAKLVGPILGEEELAHAVELLATETHQALGRRYGVHQRRLRVLLGGALILSEVQRRVVLPLEVVEAGLREGAILATAQRLAA
jgi:exopolyphosphatase/pppGpp-phosphohydrolase